MRHYCAFSGCYAVFSLDIKLFAHGTSVAYIDDELLTSEA